METRSNTKMRTFLLITCVLSFLIWLAFYFPRFANASPFNSGSTGADGAFAPTSSMTLTVPPSGTFNFTSINIPVGVTINFAPNVTNTPVTILATGNVIIDGTLNLNGQDGMSVNPANVTFTALGGIGGPGGYMGGAGGIAALFNDGSHIIDAGDGEGSGGGINRGYWNGIPSRIFAYNGQFTSNSILLPLIGGSGGAGGSAFTGISFNCGANGCNGGGGGGGGGALLLASTETITINGFITANGGAGGIGYLLDQGNNVITGSGAGSGGAIRLVANTLTGSGMLNAVGGSSQVAINISSGFTSGGPGKIRLEANVFSFTGIVNPALSLGYGNLTISLPGIVNFTSIPMLAITSVGGATVPANPTASFTTPDITLPASTTNPVSVTVAATNIPVGTTISITTYPRNGPQTSTSATLAGTAASSSGTANISISQNLPNVLLVQATFSVALAANDFPTYAEGEKVEKIRVASSYGGVSKVTLITASGKEIPLEKVRNN
ncbi:MAG: hypothetical protein HY036_08880 [Nitrospirae bacterium]|nr:hypothetical protein [Nitrospirota bacterium]MBI3352680.1 hypothetical protein [Nitrospirota bacterium]